MASVVLPPALADWHVVESIKSKRGNMYEVKQGEQTRVLRIVPVPVTEFGISPMVLRELMSLSIQHPNIVRTYEVDVADVMMYMLTEAASGNLKHLCKVVSPDAKEIRNSIAIDVSNGLAALHQCNYIHRRLTAHNVLIFGHHPKYKAKLGDLQHLQCDHLSLAYTAPEVLVGGEFTKESDVWSLGCLLHLIKYNALPFEPVQKAWFSSTSAEESMLRGICSVLGTPPMKYRDTYNLHEPCIGSTVDDAVIRACLQWDPEKRPTASQVVQRLGGRASSKCATKSPAVRQMSAVAKEVCEDILKLVHDQPSRIIKATEQLFSMVIGRMKVNEPLNYTRYYDIFGTCYIIVCKVLTDVEPERIYADAMGALHVPDKRLVYVPLERELLRAIGYRIPLFKK